MGGMAKRSDKRNIRKITKVGGHSLAVTIPIEMARKLKWRERQKVVVKQVGKRLIIEDWEK
jgi:antitoxin component of MazEF toxin-antitoxin module